MPGGKRAPGLGGKKAIDDVQGIMEGPWKDYLQGPSMGDGEHGVQAVHESPDGNDFQTFMGQFDKAKGVLGSLQSAAKSIQSLAKLAGLAESLGKFGGALGALSDFAIPSSPGAMVTSLLKGSGLLGPSAPPKQVGATAATGVDGIVVTTGGAGAEADGKAIMASIGKNENGSGSQSQGEGSDKSVSKESTGGDVELVGDGGENQNPENQNPEEKPEQAGEYSEVKDILDSDNSDWKKAEKLVELAKGKFLSVSEAHDWIQNARRESQEWSSSNPLLWSHYNLKGEMGGWAGAPLFEGYELIKYLGLDDELQWAGPAAENLVRKLEGREPLPNPFEWEPSDWNTYTSDWFYAGVKGKTPTPPAPSLPPGYMRHPLFPQKVVSPQGEAMSESEARDRFQT